MISRPTRFAQNSSVGRIIPALLIWLVAGAFIGVYLPALPVDETRYLTVAWEMYSNQQWLLPTLNGDAYSHKPPLLIWILSASWYVLGPEFWVARATALLITASLLLMTARVAAKVYPKHREIPVISVLLLLAMPLFWLYGTLIMFDALLSIFVLLALLCLWRIATSPSPAATIGFGLAIGLGLLSKGPVILLHLFFPVALAKFWINSPAPRSRSTFFTYVTIGLLIGVTIALAWAIPAAFEGGEDFAEMIFWKQSAGRLSSSFAHPRPIWFYVPVGVAGMLTLLLWKPLQKSWQYRSSWPALDPASRFLICWMVPTFAVFSVLSGKQPHYILPLLPGVALLCARAISGVNISKQDIAGVAGMFAVLFAVLAISPILVGQFGPSLHAPTPWTDGVRAFHPIAFALCGGVSLFLFVILRHSVPGQCLAMASANALLFAAIVSQSSSVILKAYDLKPIARVLIRYGGAPVAATGNYNGELGYLARLEKPPAVIATKDLRKWFERNPGGVAITRRKLDRRPMGFDVVFSMPYRRRETIDIVRMPPALKEG